MRNPYPHSFAQNLLTLVAFAAAAAGISIFLVEGHRFSDGISADDHKYIEPSANLPTLFKRPATEPATAPATPQP